MKELSSLVRTDFYLSDQSPIIVYPCQNSLTDSCYWDFIDATLAVQDFKIIVVTPAVNVSVEERADNRLVTADIMATAWQQPILRLKKAEEVKRQMNRLDEYI